jgi:TIR domain
VKRSESGRYSNSSGARPRGGRPGRTGRCRTARIFISHSSRDDEPARRMKAWLKAQGFENTFPDKDKLTGIPPADWEKTLYREIERSHAVVIIQTPQWLASKWCVAEFTQARALGKAILPVIETLTGDTRISPDIQTLDLTDDPRAQTSRSTADGLPGKLRWRATNEANRTHEIYVIAYQQHGNFGMLRRFEIGVHWERQISYVLYQG